MSNPRIPRKPGQPANSKKHSDLYTDENPKGTIHGLGFKDVATAKASVTKIRNSSRSHAHKIQAAVAMEQRAREMGKTSEAAVYRKFINTMKKKTKEMNEETNGKCKAGSYYCYTDKKCKPIPAGFMVDPEGMLRKENGASIDEDLRDWFGKSKSKDGKPGWVQADGSPCANEKEDGKKTPKCFSSQRLASLKAQGKKGEALIRSAVRRKREKDKGQQAKSGGAKPTMVRTFKKKEDYKKHPSGDRSESVQYEGKMEKDHEVSMAQSQLKNAEKDIKKLKKSLGKKEKNIPAWMQAKITDTEHNMDAAASYSESKSPMVQKILEKIECEKEWALITEKNVPTNPSLWSKMKARAKAKFDVYPSAYANGWAAKEYKKAGGGWKSVSEEVEQVEEAVKIPYQRGNIYLVSFMWRGKLMMMKVFFPEVKKPTRNSVQDAIKKIYPGATVKRFDEIPFDQGDSYLNVGEEVELDEASPTGYNKGERYKGKAGAMSDDEVSKSNEGAAERIRKSIKMRKEELEVSEGAAWTKKSGKNPEGGLNEKGRKSYERENPGSDLKAPSKKVGNKRRASFCARMKGMKKKLTSAKTARDPDSRINKSLRAWNC